MTSLLTAWGQAATEAGADNLANRKIRVTTTVGMIADIVKNVGGDRVEVIGLMGPGVDPHLYKPSKSDVDRLKSADTWENVIMEQEGLFRWFFIAGSDYILTDSLQVLSEENVIHQSRLYHYLIAIFVATFSISAYFRGRARRSSEIIPRVREGKLSLLLRLLFAAPIYLSFFAYMVNPDWMAWSSVILPAWLRWLAVAAGIVMLPVLYWVVSTLGRNISETVLTKDDHELVTQGPYRWVRHPLYSVATIIFFSLGILAANWFIMVMAFLIIISIVLVVIPKEEAQLIEKFGAKYRVYMKETGRLLPHLIR